MSEKHDVVFVVLDSARKDRVSAFGGDRETTPALEAIASAATTYENALVPAPWTLPSHCSMFTGMYPSEHGVTNGFTDRNLRLSTELPTITELLAGRGYATAGFSNNPWVGKLSGLNRGFDRFVEWDLEISQEDPTAEYTLSDRAYSKLHNAMGRAAGQPHVLLKRRFFTSNLVDRARRWIADTADRPSFTFMNLMEAHSPYYPPKSAFRELGIETPGITEPRTLNARLLAYILGKSALAPEHRERVLDFLDASLRYQDGQLERLVSELRSQGRYDDALIVVCADHGKTLGEYDRDATPPHYTRDINVDVPLVIKWPNQHRGEHVETPVELVELFDVIRDTIDANATPGLTTRPDGALVEDYVPHTGRDATDVVRWRVLADESRKYVRGEGGEEYLFERGTREREVHASEREFVGYRDRLAERVEDLSESTESTADEAATEDLGDAVEGQLQDLGYLS